VLPITAKADDLPKRRSIRMPDFDYTQAGAYFVTIRTHRRTCILAEVVEENRVVLTDAGGWVYEIWASMAAVDAGVAPGEFIVMPNHLHGILWLGDGTAGVPAVVGAFKSLSTRRVNAVTGRVGTHLWQRGYHEHVIRSDAALDRIREYIAGNPAKWHVDHENPVNWSRRFSALRAKDGPGKPGPYK
jgi:REP element-mobilizing transposase RayT